MSLKTHGVIMTFGRHKGELLTRVPVSYLKWMINNTTQMVDYAKAEFKRRGDTMPKVELSGHAIDNASLRILSEWKKDRIEDEGLYSFLQRMTLEALNLGIQVGENKYRANDMVFVIEQGEEFPILLTVMRNKDENT